MATIRRSFVINAPIEKVFAFLANHTNDPRWLPGMADARNSAGEGTGYRWEWTYKMVGISFDGTGRVTEHNPPRRHVVETQGGVTSTWAWTLEPEGDRTRILLEMEYMVPVVAVGKIAERLLLKQNEKAADEGLANLQRILAE